MDKTMLFIGPNKFSRKIAAHAVRANGKNYAEPLPHKVSPVLSTRETATHFNL